MPIFRVSRLSGHFATVDHRFLERKDISSKVKGVLAYLLHRPDDWSVSITHMARNCFMETTQWLQKVFKELIGLGYIRRVRIRAPDGKLGEVEYKIYEIPYIQYLAEKEANPENKSPIKQTVQKDLSVVSFSGSKTIGDSIDEPQRQQIHQVLQSLPKQPTNLDDLTEQVIFVLLDKNAFTRAENNFSRKLNSIAKVIREGRWEVPSAYKAKQSASSPATQEAKKLNDLKSKITSLEHQIHSSEIAKQAAENIPELAEGHKKTIEINHQKLTELKTALRAFSPQPQNAMAAAHSLVSKHVNAETTTDTRIRTLKEKKRLLLQQLASAKSAQTQFKDYPAIAEQHAKSITEYQQFLLDIDTELQNLIQPLQSPGECRA